MFVQYSFIEKHDYPAFKREPLRLGSASIVALGILAMLVVTVGFVALS